MRKALESLIFHHCLKKERKQKSFSEWFKVDQTRAISIEALVSDITIYIK